MKPSLPPFRLRWLAPVGVLGFFLLAAPPIAGMLRGLVALPNPFAVTSSTRMSGPVVLREVQRLNRLETCRYQGQAVVEGDTGGKLPRWLSGDRMLFVAHGEVVAGMDLARMDDADVQVAGDQVSLRLPEPEILYSRLDNRSSQVFERRSGVFSGPDKTLETRVRQSAEDHLREAALSSGLLETARENARKSLEEHFGRLGFRQVRIL